MLNATNWIFPLCLSLLILGSGSPAASDISGRVVVQGDQGMLDITFSDRDRDLIREYYGYTPKHKHLPPGLAKKGKLPPGIQKQMRRHEQLPPGVQYQYVPQELEQHLSRIPDGYARVMVGGSFVLFDERTRVILDVMQAFD